MTTAETNLFTPHTLQGMNLRNRFVRSATHEGLNDLNGNPTGPMIDIYRQLAAGGTGLIISGITAVSADGILMPNSAILSTDAHTDGIRQMADAVHAEEGVLCLQIGHCGGQGRKKICGGATIAPSAVKLKQYPGTPREMSLADIEQIIAAFAAAAGRAKEAGCDAVQLHAAHGYLLNQFLSPLTNQRTDAYGGDIDGRSRILLEIVAAVRQSCGPKFPMLVKLNGSDHLEGGLEIDDAQAVARSLDAAGITAIEISSGTPASGEQTPIRAGHPSGDEMAYNVVLSRTIKQHVSCPIMVVGGIRSLHVATGLLRTNQADYISLCRPLIREPDLPNKLQSGASEKSTCTSCNGCLNAMVHGEFRCVLPTTTGE